MAETNRETKFPTSQPTREDVRIRENREKMGVIFFRKKGESRGLGSGSIVNLEGSKLFRNCEEIKWCLLTSDSYLPVKDIGVGDYFFEFLSSDLKTVNKHSLRDVAQSDDFYHPTAGLALIPVRPSWVSKQFTGVGIKSSVLDKRRTFPTKYYCEGVESESCENIQCFIVKSCECKKEPLTVESFTLITERDDQGRTKYCLRDDDDVDKTIFRRYDDIITKRWQLYPRGAVILEFDDPKAACACIGILNFTEEGLISPVFFTPETLTGKVQLYYPTLTDNQEKAPSKVEEESSPINQTDSAVHSQAVPHSIVTGHGKKPKVGASLTNDDRTVLPDDYTLQKWQKLYEEVKDENTELKQKCEGDQKMIAILKDGNAELRSDIKRTEQQNEELRAENEDLLQKNDSLRSENEELRTKYKKLRKDQDAEVKVLKEDYREVLTENDHLKATNRELHVDNRKLRSENIDLRKEKDTESRELREVNENLRAENKELKTQFRKLLTENEELSARLEEVTDQLKALLSQPTSVLGEDDTSSIKDSDNMKVEGPSGSAANSPQGDSDGSQKEEKQLFSLLSEDGSPELE